MHLKDNLGRTSNGVNCVFWGTPEFSLPSLKFLVDSPGIEVMAVITQPDKPRHRSKTLIPSPIKVLASSKNIPVFAPANLKDKAFKENFKNLGNCDINVIVAYGKLIPVWFINYPRLGSVNLHPSFLPKFRGPSPIQSAILTGEKTSGVSVMLIDEKMDHGPILTQTETPIVPEDDYKALESKLASAGAKLLVKTIKDYAAGKIEPQEQNHAKATYSKLLAKKDGGLDFSKSAAEIHNQIRALNPWPGTYTFWQEKIIIITKARVEQVHNYSKPGKVFQKDGKIVVAAGKDGLAIIRLKLSGKKEQSIAEFMNGYPQFVHAELPS